MRENHTICVRVDNPGWLSNVHHCCKCICKCMTSLFYSNYDKLHLLYAGGSHVSRLECLYDCFLDNMFLFCRNKPDSYFILITAYFIQLIIIQGIKKLQGIKMIITIHHVITQIYDLNVWICD